jgi:pimeloyl-ACP methyl ester carboxylesterase
MAPGWWRCSTPRQLDNWDPALIDALARGRRVITFDNRGVSASTGTTPSTIAQMALDAIDFADALGVGEVDLLGFSIGSFLAQEIALVRPSTVRKLVLASSAPQGASGHARLGARRDRRSRQARAVRGRLPQRLLHRLRDEPRSGTASRQPRIRGAHRRPRFVATGDSDPMILPRYSHLLAGLIPDAQLKTYPDAAHGFLFQHHAEFAADVDAFLASA